MKKIMKPFVLVAAAAMALASCQKNEMPAPEKQDVHFTINAGIETKTSIVETLEDNKIVYKAQWDGNEELGVLFAAPNAETTTSDVVKLTNAECGRTASFQGNVALDKSSGTFYAFYPAAAFNKGYKEGDARLDLKNAQKPTATSFDPSCDILVAKPYDYTVEEGAVVADGLEFARLMSVLRIDLKSEFADIQNEFIESVSFTAGDVEITGYARVVLDNPKFDKWASNGAQWCTVTANYDSDLVSINGTSNSVYLVIAPVTIPADKDLTFEIKTKNYNISKTIKSPEMKFTAGKVSKINLTIAADNCDKINTSIDYSGEYLIAGKEGDKWYAAKKYTSGNYLAVSEIEFIGENIVETEAISDHYMTITKVVGGDYDGMYTIQDAGGLYLSTVHNSENYLKAVESLSADTYWTLTKEDEEGTFSIVASKSQYTRNDMRFNYNSGTNSRVSCYDGTKTAQPYLALFSTSLVKPDTTPRIIVAEEALTQNVDADATRLSFNYSLKNISGVPTATVAEGATMTNVSATADNGTVTVTFAANEEESPKTATVTLSYEGAENVNVTITQAAKPAEGEPEVKTWLWEGGGKADFIGLENVETKGLGSDYAASHAPYQIKMDGTGDYFIIGVDGAVQSASVGVKMIGGNSTSYLDVQGSSDGETFTSVQKFTISGAQNSILKFVTSNTFDASYRYVKFYFTKGSNIGVGPISITYVSTGGTDPEPTLTERNLDFSSATATATMGEEFTEPTLSGVTDGVTYVSSNTEVAIVDASTGEVTLIAAGSTTITASASANATHAAGEASYTLTVNPAQSGGEVLTATFDFVQIYNENGGPTSNVTISNITFLGEKGSASTPARAWNDGLRTYAGNVITFTAASGYVITKIEGATALAFEGSQQSVKFDGLSKSTIKTPIVVTYQAN